MAKEHIFIANMHLSVLENQLLSSIFADYISILAKLRRNTADIQGIWMDYQNKTLFLNNESTYRKCLREE